MQSVFEERPCMCAIDTFFQFKISVFILTLIRKHEISSKKGSNIFRLCLYEKYFAGVAKLVDALDLGSSAARHGGSSPSTRTLQTFTVSNLEIVTGRFFSL